jgi:hypothetical protein
MARFSVGDEVRTAGGDRVLLVRKLTGSGGYKLRDSVTRKKVAFEWYDEELEPAVREAPVDEPVWKRANVGDWVRIREAWAYGGPGEYQVVEVDDGDDRIRLRVLADRGPSWVANSRVKAIVAPPAQPPTFRVGDRVRFTDKVNPTWWFSTGQTGTIVEVDYNDNLKYGVHVDQGPYDHPAWVSEEHIEIKSEHGHNFHIGDRVEYARRDTHGFRYLPAIHYRDTGMVVSMDGPLVAVRLDRNGFRVTTAATDWRPEDISDPPSRTFKPGDWVRDAHDGQVGVVFHDSGEPEDESPYRVGHPDSGEYFDYSAADLLPN